MPASWNAQIGVKKLDKFFKADTESEEELAEE